MPQTALSVGRFAFAIESFDTLGYLPLQVVPRGVRSLDIRPLLPTETPEPAEIAAFRLKTNRRAGPDDRRERWRGGRRDTDWYNFTANRAVVQNLGHSSSAVNHDHRPMDGSLLPATRATTS
jgi:hypothetical protein